MHAAEVEDWSGTWVGRSPILCKVPLDSLDLSPCESSVVRTENGGRCTTTGTRDGERYTITGNYYTRNIKRQKLPILDRVVLKGGVIECRISSNEPITGFCLGTGNERGGSGFCRYCTTTSCHEAHVSIRIRKSNPNKRAEK